MQAKNIGEVIAFLKEIIEVSKKEKSTMGYFAALYYNVTLKVWEGIQNGIFEDNERMEKLDVIFANRYLKAYTEFKNKEKTSDCWDSAFLQSTDYWPVVLQHLLLGMNAHINLDLGIAAAQICPGEQIHGLKNDFDKINEILASLVKSVEEDLCQVWPTLIWILKKTQKVDSFLINFSMKLARDGAWKYANSLALLDSAQLPEGITTRDGKVRKKAALISNPGWIPSLLFKFVRLGEKGSVVERIEWLELQATD